MAVNPLDPGFVRLFYQRAGVNHVATYQISFAVSPSVGVDPLLVTRGGSDFFSTLILAWSNVIKTSWNNTASIQRAEVWSKATPASDPVYVFEIPINIVGTNASAPVVAGQFVMTFRSGEGNILRLYFMETVLAPNQVLLPPYTVGSQPEVNENFIEGSTNFILARDDSFTIGSIRSLTKVNDALRKKLILNT